MGSWAACWEITSYSSHNVLYLFDGYDAIKHNSTTRHETNVLHCGQFPGWALTWGHTRFIIRHCGWVRVQSEDTHSAHRAKTITLKIISSELIPPQPVNMLMLVISSDAKPQTGRQTDRQTLPGPAPPPARPRLSVPGEAGQASPWIKATRCFTPLSPKS